jgi:hypothetical protein
MSFGKVYGNVLSPFVKEFEMAKNQKVREGVIKNATDTVIKSRETLEDASDDLPKDLKTVGKNFFLSSSVSTNFHL